MRSGTSARLVIVNVTSMVSSSVNTPASIFGAARASAGGSGCSYQYDTTAAMPSSTASAIQIFSSCFQRCMEMPSEGWPTPIQGSSGTASLQALCPEHAVRDSVR
jgi:hypothetical protein